MSDIGYPIILADGTTLGGGTYQILDVSQVANSIADTSVTSLSLQRRGGRNYAEITSENLVHMLENFSSSTPPPNPLQGQLWFNPGAGTAGELMIYDTTSNWNIASNPKTTGLQTAVNISLNGDATGSTLFDGTQNVTIPVTLANQPGLAAGTYTSPTLTIDAKGLITAATGTALGAGQVNAALGYTAANDAAVVHKTGDTMTGTLTVSGGNVNTVNGGLIMENGNALLPSGVICMWSGSSSAVPAGWNLCDGTNSTPDLRGRFIAMSGGDAAYSDGQTGGSNLQGLTTTAAGSHSHNVTVASAGSHNHTGSTDGYALTNNDLPSHTHAFGSSLTVQTGTQTNYVAGSSSGSWTHVWDNPVGTQTGATGGGLAHTHPIETDGTHTHSAVTDTAPNHTHTVSFDNRPEFYAIAFIMKL